MGTPLPHHVAVGCGDPEDLPEGSWFSRTSDGNGVVTCHGGMTKTRMECLQNNTWKNFTGSYNNCSSCECMSSRVCVRGVWVCVCVCEECMRVRVRERCMRVRVCVRGVCVRGVCGAVVGVWLWVVCVWVCVCVGWMCVRVCEGCVCVRVCEGCVRVCVRGVCVCVC